MTSSTGIMCEKLTVDELANALERVNIHLGTDASYGGSKHTGKATYPDALARDLFRDVEKHREPLYESGAIYIDAYGEKWQYSGFSKRWYAFGSEAPFPFEAPKRPLRKMVAEGTWKIDWNKVTTI